MLISKFSRLPRMHQILITLISAVTVLLMLLPEPEAMAQPERKFQIGKSYPLELSINGPQLQASGVTPPLLPPPLAWTEHVIEPGESLALVFDKVGLSPATLYRLINADEGTKSLITLRPGDKLRFGLDENKDLVQLIQPVNATETLFITRKGDTFHSRKEVKSVDTQLNFAQAVITSSFWNAASDAGLTGNQIMEIAGIFGWDIDFALDIREGDTFSVLFEERYVEGEPIGRGNILAATFTNLGQTFTAIRNSKDGKYYDPEGRAMQKAFLRSPVNFRYVSSNFNPRRLHPVTGQVKAHRGTDYVAPVGTPIWAAGDGIVMKSGYNQFNGNYVFIRHSSTYITKYLHLSKRLVKTGQRVKQGQTIGKLGSSGRVTGAHLHYEFLVNGVHKNPRTVSLPQADSLSGKAKAAFIQQANERLGQLTQFRHLLAANTNASLFPAQG
ncbi:peptidoglycan DD-metalloendopeptidase family protein [Photobacterium sp. 1_MG-2023]|uniref:peptidoglycan DD-metalloendopeptidase family protein n=1 Tax=Photobacterium sp. 1_MG-2023 TaxID=3062646 RepID=UPI0026E2A0A3|nr:peptidoglycan DD-metalloendopeptidase family protein [Photobacterium sp. 1_MG-2023]MDO6704833.1 peptidoglycan DD-metalloendopeptidase family protein [Photobacterium sp. 1_MG-2023]